MVTILRPNRRISHIPGMGVRIGGRAVSAGGNGLLNALIAYWPGNEASGNALDVHINGLHLTDYNTVTNDTGLVYATARQYTAANLEYHRRDSYSFAGEDNDLTVAGWVYLATKAAFRFAFGNAYQSYAVIFEGGPDRYVWRGKTMPNGWWATTAISFGSPPLATWTFIVAWHDAVNDEVCVQINDGTVDSVANANGIRNTGIDRKFVIGRDVDSGGWHWNGRVGPTAFWKSGAGGGGVLTAAQRTALYNGGAGLPYTSFTS